MTRVPIPPRPRPLISGWCADKKCKPGPGTSGCRMDGCEHDCHKEDGE